MQRVWPLIQRLVTPRQGPLWQRATIAVAISMAAIAVRQFLLGDEPIYPFITAYPAVVVVTMVAGVTAGATALVTLVAIVQLLFVKPYAWPLPVAWQDVVAALAFGAFGGVMIAIIGAFQSTLRQLAEANRRLAATDQEKELLLREIAHRIQNHFSALTAAVRFERRGAADRAVQDVLLALEARILALARINARLAYRGGKASIDCKEMIEALIQDLQVAGSDRRIAIRLDMVDGHRLPLQQAAPIGLALCEMVTNALKHAFPHGRSGSVTVRFQGRGEIFQLEVADDGVGEDDVGEAGGAKVGSGSFLLDAFSRQLGGTFRKEPGTPSGTRSVVTFPRTPIDEPIDSGSAAPP